MNVNKFGEIAAFDFDGTVRRGDAGDGFFEYTVNNRYFGFGPKQLAEFNALAARLGPNDYDGYVWLAQVHNGLREEEVRRAAKDFHQAEGDHKFFPEMLDLIRKLKARGTEILVVSASTRWSLEPFIQELDLPPGNLLSIETIVENRIITNKPITPVTFKQGKVDAIKKRIGDRPLTYAFGNSMGDLAMLEYSQNPTVINSLIPHPPSVASSELELRQIAQQRGWPIQIF